MPGPHPRFTPEERLERRRESVRRSGAKRRRAFGIPERAKPTDEERREYRRVKARRHYHRTKAQQQAQRHANPEPFRAKERTYRQNNRDKVAASSNASYYRHQQKNQQRGLAYYYAHLDENRAKNRARKAASRTKDQARARERRQENPAPFRAKELRRRALKRGAPISDYTAAQWREQQELQEHRCYYCAKRRKGKLTQDHIIPLSQGGSHTASNIIAACQSCNSKKSDKAPPIPVQMNLLLLAAPKKRTA